MVLEFTKMQALGNDFVVVDATRQAFTPPPAALSRLADRRFGVGCDQILVLDPSPRPGVDYGYRIYNADGSPAGHCGNGARALARFIDEQGAGLGDGVTIATPTVTARLARVADGLFTVDMGEPCFEPAGIPLTARRAAEYEASLDTGETVRFGAVGLGNPHAVLLTDPDRADVARLGPAVQRLARFPAGVNVGFLGIDAPDAGRLRVYERGAGETLACGTGACAAMAVARARGLIAETFTITMPGGALTLAWPGPGHPLTMTGTAETVFRGEIAWPMT